MPIGIIIDVCGVALGGIIGSMLGGGLSERFTRNINMIFGLASMGMGISTICLMENMPPVVLSLVAGTSIGLIIHFGDRINSGAALMQQKIGGDSYTKEQMDLLVTTIVLFCASGTGIYGAMISGMSGDHSILIAKAILDFFTAIIFGCTLGRVLALVAVPQAVIMLALFFLAGLIFPLTTPSMINDFKACGGFIMVATGFRILQLKMFPTADMIPAMILVMPLSAFWTGCVMPLLGG